MIERIHREAGEQSSAGRGEEREVVEQRSAVVVPLASIWRDIIAAASAAYEGRVPVRKVATVDGLPAAEWRAGVEAELARMPVNA